MGELHFWENDRILIIFSKGSELALASKCSKMHNESLFKNGSFTEMGS